MEPWQFVLLGVSAAAIGYSLVQGTRRRGRLSRQDSLADALSEIQAMEASARGIVQQLEVRAYDYSREVEARIDNRLSVLDQLIEDADREIDRLQAILAESRQTMPVQRELSAEEQQRCFALKEAGFAADEIARCLHVSPNSVQETLSQWRRPAKRAA